MNTYTVIQDFDLSRFPVDLMSSLSHIELLQSANHRIEYILVQLNDSVPYGMYVLRNINDIDKSLLILQGVKIYDGNFQNEQIQAIDDAIYCGHGYVYIE